MTRKHSIMIIILLIIISSITGCISTQESEQKPSITTLTIGVADPVFGFHPYITSYDVSTLSINHNIFNTLVGFDDQFRITPELAVSWSNPNNLTWRFVIRDNVYFHNGNPLTTEDIKYSIDILLDNNTSVFQDLLINIKEIILVDNNTIDIITKKPCPILLNKLTDIFIVSKIYQETTTTKIPMGTGAYHYVNYSENTVLTLARHEKYWKTLPDYQTVIYEFIENAENRAQALLNHEVDIAENLPIKQYQNLSNQTDIQLKITINPTVTFLGFDFRENNSIGFPDTRNPLADVRVRQALYHAINIDKIIKELTNEEVFAIPATQYVTPLIFGYNPNITKLSYDLNLSKALLNEAGYPQGFDLILDSPKDFYEHGQICRVIEQQLSKIINITQNQIPTDEFFTKLLTRNTSMYIVGWLAATGDGGEIYDYLLRSVNESKGVGTYNIGFYSNPEIDQIGEEIQNIMNPMQRLARMQEGFQIAMNDVACIPLVTSKILYGMLEHVDWTPSANMIIKVETIKLKI